jgi:hypothetical protein
VTGKDVIGTWKILTAIVVLPTLYFIYSCIVAIVISQFDVPSHWKWLAPLLTFLLLPIMSYIGVHIFESGLQVYRSLKPLILAILPSSHSPAEQLRKMRNEIQGSVNDVIYELGPHFLPDFQQRMAHYESDSSHAILRDSSESEDENSIRNMLKAEVVDSSESLSAPVATPEFEYDLSNIMSNDDDSPVTESHLQRVSSWVTCLARSGDDYFKWEEGQSMQSSPIINGSTLQKRHSDLTGSSSHLVLPSLVNGVGRSKSMSGSSSESGGALRRPSTYKHLDEDGEKDQWRL